MLVALAGIMFSVLVALLIVDRVLAKGDVLSSGSVIIYFSILGWIPLAYFAAVPDALGRLILEPIAPEYRDLGLVTQAYVWAIISTIFLYVGSVFGSKIRTAGLDSLGLWLFASKQAWDHARFPGRTVKVVCLAALGSGLAALFYYVGRLGGFAFLWDNLALRTTLSAGMGYLTSFYSFSLVFGGALALVAFRRSKVVSIMILVGVFVALVSVGQRAPAIGFIFVVLVVRHFMVRRWRGVWNLKFAAVSFVAAALVLGLVQFRSPGAIGVYMSSPMQLVGDSVAGIEEHLIRRLGTLERDVVVLGYFKEHDVWMGAGYYSLLAAPVPRGLWSDKPPVDTGQYLRAMAAGQEVDPPVPSRELQATSWPDGHWAGYMNFHIPGYLAMLLLSGYLVGWWYRFARYSGFHFGAVVGYGMIAWNGAPAMSPYSIVGLLMTFFWLFFWVRIYAVFKRLGSSAPTMSPVGRR